MLHLLTNRFVWALVLSCLVASCSREQPQKSGPKESFEQLLGQFKERAAKKATTGCSITVNGQLDGKKAAAEALDGSIQIRKEILGNTAENLKPTVTIFDLNFVFEANDWHCKKASCKDFAGEKVMSENSIGGPNIGLTNLFIWVGL